MPTGKVVAKAACSRSESPPHSREMSLVPSVGVSARVCRVAKQRPGRISAGSMSCTLGRLVVNRILRLTQDCPDQAGSAAPRRSRQANPVRADHVEELSPDFLGPRRSGGPDAEATGAVFRLRLAVGMHKHAGAFEQQGALLQPLNDEAELERKIIKQSLQLAARGATQRAVNRMVGKQQPRAPAAHAC